MRAREIRRGHAPFAGTEVDGSLDNRTGGRHWPETGLWEANEKFPGVSPAYRKLSEPFLGTVPLAATPPGFAGTTVRAVDFTETPLEEYDLRGYLTTPDEREVFL